MGCLLGGFLRKLVRHIWPCIVSSAPFITQASIIQYYPLYNNQPITSPHSHCMIGKYNLYFPREKLYWTVSGEPSNIGYIGQFWNEPACTYPMWPADRPLANVKPSSKLKCQMLELQKTGKRWWMALIPFNIINNSGGTCVRLWTS